MTSGSIWFNLVMMEFAECSHQFVTPHTLQFASSCRLAITTPANERDFGGCHKSTKIEDVTHEHTPPPPQQTRLPPRGDRKWEIKHKKGQSNNWVYSQRKKCKKGEHPPYSTSIKWRWEAAGRLKKQEVIEDATRHCFQIPSTIRKSKNGHLYMCHNGIYTCTDDTKIKTLQTEWIGKIWDIVLFIECW